MTYPTTSRTARVSRLFLRLALLGWAGFWAWFVLSVSLGEPPAPPVWIPAAWLTALAGLVVLGWRWPRLGGLVLVAAGIGLAAVFRHPGAQALLAAPAVVLGLVCAIQGWSARQSVSQTRSGRACPR